MSVHVGFGTWSGQVPPDGSQTPADVYADFLALARTADEEGLDSIWVSEHHGTSNAHLPSPLVLLAAAAADTRRIQLGTAMALAPFQHPLRFAEDAAVLDQLSRGRLRIGLGAGWRAAEFAAFGILVKERVGRTAELARILRLAWDQEHFSFVGKYWTFDDVAVTPKPFGRVPLLLGGNVPAAAARAGRLADGLITTPHNRIEKLRELVSAMDAAARAAGRDPSDLTVGFHVNGWVTRDKRLPADVQRAMWNQMGAYKAWHDHDDGRSAASGTLPPVDEAMIRSEGMLGTPRDIVEQARPWIEEFGHRKLAILFRLHYPGIPLDETREMLRLFAGEVAPALRRLAPSAPRALASA